MRRQRPKGRRTHTMYESREQTPAAQFGRCLASRSAREGSRDSRRLAMNGGGAVVGSPTKLATGAPPGDGFSPTRAREGPQRMHLAGLPAPSSAGATFPAETSASGRVVMTLAPRQHPLRRRVRGGIDRCDMHRPHHTSLFTGIQMSLKPAPTAYAAYHGAGGCQPINRARARINRQCGVLVAKRLPGKSLRQVATWSCSASHGVIVIRAHAHDG